MAGEGPSTLWRIPQTDANLTCLVSSDQRLLENGVLAALFSWLLDLQDQGGLELSRGLILQAHVRPYVVVVAAPDLDSTCASRRLRNLCFVNIPTVYE
jgi:hypothetical protein